MAHNGRKALSQRICNFHYDSAKKSVKTAVNYFKEQDVPQSTRYYVLKEYLQYGTTKDLSRSDHSLNLSKNLNNIIKAINNRCGLSQHKIHDDLRCIIQPFCAIFEDEHHYYKKTLKKLQEWIMNNNKFEHGKTVVS